MAISRASNSSIQGGLPKFNDIWDGTTATSAFDSIGSVALSSTSDVSFINIPQTYTHLQLRVFARTSRSDATVDTVYFRFNGDTGNNYNVHAFSGAGGGGTPTSASYGSPTVLWGAFNTPSSTATANRFSASIIDIFDYTNTSKFTTTRTFGGNDMNGSGSIDFFSGLWKNTSAITSIRLFAEGNFVSGSHIALYGIK